MDICRLLETAEMQHSVFTRDQAFECGSDKHAIYRKVRSGLWDRILPGVFAVAGAEQTWVQRAQAAALWVGTDSAVSHSTAAVIWGLDVVKQARIDVTSPRILRSPAPWLIVHSSNGFGPSDTRVVDSMNRTTPERTIVDISGGVTTFALERAIHSALCLGLTTVDRIIREVQRLGGAGRPGSSALRKLLASDEPPSESDFELQFERLISRARLPKPARQWQVTIRSDTFRFDFAYPDIMVGIECESRRFHGSPSAFERDIRRIGALANAGWLVVRVTWWDVANDPKGVADRVRAAIEERRRPNPSKVAHRATFDKEKGLGQDLG